MMEASRLNTEVCRDRELSLNSSMHVRMFELVHSLQTGANAFVLAATVKVLSLKRVKK